MLTTPAVYDPVASEPFVLISASNSRPRPRGRPIEDRPVIIEGPGTPWALVMCAQDAILCNPLEYWNATVFPAGQMPMVAARVHRMWID